MTWTTGLVTLGGGLEVASGQTLSIATGGQHVLGAGQTATALHNHGTVAWSGGEIYLQGNTAVVNESDGVWDVQGDLDFNSSSCGSPTFTNAGMLRKSAGSGALQFVSCVATVNTSTGTIELQSGTVTV
jgi:hypothetical protein